MDSNIKGITEKASKKTSGFISEFKEFALRGNVVDMAVGVVIGSAFGAIVNSIVDDLITPVIAHFTAGADYTGLIWMLDSTNGIAYGSFIQTVINFLIIAFSIFVVIKVLGKFRRKQDEEKKEEKPSETDVLIEIRDMLKENNK